MKVVRRARPGNAIPQLLKKRSRVRGGRAVHRQQRQVVRVLQRDVDVLAHLVVGRDLVDQLLGEVGRVAVQQADPAQALDPRQLAQQRGQRGAVLPVAAVLVGVLGDEVELEGARGDERAGLGDDVDPGLGAEGAAVMKRRRGFLRFLFSKRSRGNRC